MQAGRSRKRRRRLVGEVDIKLQEVIKTGWRASASPSPTRFWVPPQSVEVPNI